MSVIVALIHNSSVYVGSDTLVVNEIGEVWLDKPKVWSPPSNKMVLIGGVGPMAVIETVRQSYPFYDELPTLEGISAWLKPLTDEFRSFTEWEFIFCGNGRIFIARWDFLVIEAKKYEAIGPGREIALGSLFGSDGLSDDPFDRIHRSLSAAMTYDTSVGGSIEIKIV